MQVPRRKGDPRLNKKVDPYLTEGKYRELVAKLERMRNSRPRLAEEVKRLAEMGDFSENAGYQLAKGRLRGLNQRILDLENHLKVAVIIETNPNTETIQIGSRVTLEREGKEKTYLILGSTESDPTHSVISYQSPLGAVLMGHKAGEKVDLSLADKLVEYMITRVEQA
ncbi:MAG: GreA/GreB family elongation factor [Patescibacteria group bacterium]